MRHIQRQEEALEVGAVSGQKGRLGHEAGTSIRVGHSVPGECHSLQGEAGCSQSGVERCQAETQPSRTWPLCRDCQNPPPLFT